MSDDPKKIVPVASWLPIRPKPEHFKREARDRQRKGSARTYMAALDDVARDHGFRNWREMDAAIQQRWHHIEELENAIRCRDPKMASQVLRRDSHVALDVGVVSTNDDIQFFIPLLANTPLPLIDLVIAVLEKHALNGLKECVDTLMNFVPERDRHRAAWALKDRIHRLPNHEAELIARQLEATLGWLDSDDDEPEFEPMEAGDY